MSAQKVVIPKGLINPNETTIIEIPEDMQKIPAVIAKRRNKPAVNQYGSFGGDKEEDPADVADGYSENPLPDYHSSSLLSSVGGEPIKQRLTVLSRKDATIEGINLDDIVGEEKKVDDNDNLYDDYSDTQFRGKEFERSDILKQESQKATPRGRPRADDNNWSNAGTNEYGEGSYLPAQSDDALTKEAIKEVLDKMDYVELSKIKRDLRNFQNARRKLIFDATSMSPQFK